MKIKVTTKWIFFILLLLIVIFFTIFGYCFFAKSCINLVSKNYDFLESDANSAKKKISIELNEEGRVNVINEMEIKYDKSNVFGNIYLADPIIGSPNEKNPKVTVNNMQIKDIDLLYYEDYIDFQYKVYKDRQYKINANYEYSAESVVKQYNDFTVLGLNLDDKYEYDSVEYEIKLPSKVTKFEISNKNFIVNEIGVNTYQIIPKNNKVNFAKNDLYIMMDNGIVESAEVINNNCDVEIINEFNINNTELICIVSICAMIFLVYIILKKERRIPLEKVEYLRDVKQVISPILAESIVDNKINTKNCIMACIVDLISKGNIKNIDNNNIELVSKKNLESYEELIIDIIFSEGNKLTSFSRISQMFTQDKRKTRQLYKKFINVKRKIILKMVEDGLYEENISSKVLLLKILQVFLTTAIMFCSFAFAFEVELFNLIFVLIGIVVSIIFTARFLKDKYNLNACCVSDYMDIPWVMKNIIYYLIIISHFVMCLFIEKYNIVFVMILTVFSMLSYKNNKTLNKPKLSEKGKEAYVKACGMKNLIEKYSVMENRDMDSNIIWGDYLAYAVAFGLANKISNKFEESSMMQSILDVYFY